MGLSSLRPDGHQRECLPGAPRSRLLDSTAATGPVLRVPLTAVLCTWIVIVVAAACVLAALAPVFAPWHGAATGCFVPADSALVCVTDRLFTRIHRYGPTLVGLLQSYPQTRASLEPLKTGGLPQPSPSPAM